MPGQRTTERGSSLVFRAGLLMLAAAMGKVPVLERVAEETKKRVSVLPPTVGGVVKAWAFATNDGCACHYES